MFKKQYIQAVLVMASLMAIVSFNSNAHTILLGTTNNGTIGSVQFWMGTYHNGAAEGSVSIGVQTANFSNVMTTAPGAFPDSNLILGDNLFYASGNRTYAGLTRNSVGCCGNDTNSPVTVWQSAVLTGLSAGLQTYSIAGMQSVNWADSFSSAANWTGQVFIPDSSISASAPASLAFVGLGLLALGYARRKNA